jgi:hypothetical protein
VVSPDASGCTGSAGSCGPVGIVSSGKVLIFDPPFCYIAMDQIKDDAILTVTRGHTNIPLLIGFLRSKEGTFVSALAEFWIRETKFPAEICHCQT